MTWEILAILFLVVGSNIGQSYFTTYRLTDFAFIKSIFRTESKTREISDSTVVLDRRIAVILKNIDEIKNQISDIKSDLLLIRADQKQFAAVIYSQFSEKREHAQFLESHGKTILKK